MTTRGRSDLLQQIRDEQRHWRELVAEVGRERMNEPGPMGRWTFRDLVSHLHGWRERTLARLEAAAEGREEPPPPWPTEMNDDDTINAWIRERDRQRSLDDLLAAYDASFDRLATVIQAVPDDALVTPGYFAWTGGSVALVDVPLFGHLREEHEPAIRAWLASHR